MIYFHGNGEIATDYNDIAPIFHQQGADLMVIDFRGYGWSTGSPVISQLPSDSAAVLQKLPKYETSSVLGCNVNEALAMFMNGVSASAPAGI